MHFALRIRARALQHADKLLASARAAARADKRSFINGVVNSAAQAEAGCIKGLYAAMRQPKRRPQRAPQMLQLEDRSLAQSPEQVAKRWQRHFAEQMSGKVVPLSDLAAQSRLRRAELGETPALQVLPPSQDQVVGMLLSINLGQAIGEDSISASVGRTCPQAFARILTPFYQKTCSLGLWPLRWKGGNLVRLLKPLQPPQLVAPSWSVTGLGSSSPSFSGAMSSQCMMVSCTTASREVAKVGGLTLRPIPRSSSSLVPSAEGSALVACSSTSPQRFTLWSGSVHLDVTALLRVAQNPSVPWALAKMLSGTSCGCVGTTGPSCKKQACRPTQSSSSGSFTQIRGSHRWALRISPTLLAARLLATHSEISSHVVQEVRAQLLSEGIYWTVPFTPEAPWLAPQPPEPQPGENASYVDDEGVNFMHSDPQQLVQWVTRAVQIYNETCSKYGLTLNLAPGKSDSMIALRGKGGPLVREQAEAGLKVSPDCTLSGAAVPALGHPVC